VKKTDTSHIVAEVLDNFLRQLKKLRHGQNMPDAEIAKVLNKQGAQVWAPDGVWTARSIGKFSILYGVTRRPGPQPINEG
jgi:hypothetical protein